MKRQTTGIPGRMTAASTTVPQQPQQPKREPKERLTVHLPLAAIAQAKSAVYHTIGETLSGFAERAFAAEIARMEKKRGEKFPAAAVQLKGGRPIRL